VVISLLLLFLFFILLTVVLFFIFYLLLPAIKGKLYADNNPVFSPLELGIPKLRTAAASELPGKKLRAMICCSCDRIFAERRLDYNGLHSCRVFNSVYTTQNDCQWGCIGFGDCARVCPQQAIIIKNNTAVVTNFCTGCGNCIDVCPKKLIQLIPVSTGSVIACSAPEFAMTTCSTYRKEKDSTALEQKSFKFWLSCYKMLFRS